MCGGSERKQDYEQEEIIQRVVSGGSDIDGMLNRISGQEN